jgi:hypothetical protein
LRGPSAADSKAVMVDLIERRFGHGAAWKATERGLNVYSVLIPCFETTRIAHWRASKRNGIIPDALKSAKQQLRTEYQ